VSKKTDEATVTVSIKNWVSVAYYNTRAVSISSIWKCGFKVSIQSTQYHLHPIGCCSHSFHI